tara:strand:- start:2794 stop:3741 length:948 start_codon:yes stop_codon:yes gene_type:complete
MNIMITGCAGFIGSHAVEEFLAAGYNIAGVDSLTYAGDTDNMLSFIDDIEFYHLDICDTVKITNIVNNLDIEWIINFAAETHVDNSIKSSDSFIHSNVKGVASLLDACRATNAKLFHISTDEVYGSTDYGSFSEIDALDPQNPYSATKAASELLIKSYNNTHGVEYLMVRPCNNFGPRQNNEKFMPTILTKLLQNEKIPIYGDGKNIRDWLYVKENVSAIRYILENSQLGEVYNISTSNEKTNIEIVSNLCTLMSRDAADSIMYVDDRLGHDFRYSIYNKKLRDLGFFERMELKSFRSNLDKTVVFYTERSNEKA